MTDNAFLLSVLNDGRWHSNTEILQASFAERGCGLTVHSRASDLRKRGYVVETKVGTNGDRRVAFYRLGVLAAASVKQDAEAAASASIPAEDAEPSSGRGGALVSLFDMSDQRRGAYGEA